MTRHIPTGTRIGAIAQELVDALVAPLVRPWRTLLVFLAYALGAAALVAATTITQSTTGSVVERLTAAGSQEVSISNKAEPIQPWTEEDPTGAKLWQAADVQRAQVQHLDGVRAVYQVRQFAPVSNRLTRLGPGADPYQATRGTDLQLTACTAGYLQHRGLHAARGVVDPLNSTSTASVVLGSRAAEKLAVTEAGPGSVIYLNGRPVSVAAVLAPSGDAVRDAAAYFSPGTLPILSDQHGARLVIVVEPGYAEPLAKAAPLALAPGAPGTITVSTVAELARLQQGVRTDLASLMSVIGVVILVLSALTAGTTMFLAVNHRYPEIALRRAMGASRSSIARLFLYEGIAVGTAGGIVGTLLGIVVGWYAARGHNWPLCIGWQTAVLGCGVGLLTGILASLIPAIHAARRDPAGILRSA